ncbi:8-oxo-dGTP diphosphatase [Saccharopolyspora kobensis]|uniref:8-oxo-dGTP diphosphatase n=1 Tax=Saccharopolyspora kobensis TaxID=146035 RepID=A0A1H5ZLI6_9PSEU|nr:NUDIX hydrolase [Saccharopolyspora kobensis]SEG36990.1 8-oxo-dGTP diphosphatase [Saccharopolyspora kobensis]SFF20954.1 8-oxo-dGTP diphosphatase [Saccharopolyspora kobensis]
MSQIDSTALTGRDARDGIEQQVVGAVICHAGKFLVVRRPTTDFRGGTWELPSGKIEPGEDLLAASHREAAEETGLKIEAVSGYLGAFEYLSGSGKRTRQHTTTSTEDVVLTEHDAHAWSADPDEYPVSSEVRTLIAEALEMTAS